MFFACLIITGHLNLPIVKINPEDFQQIQDGILTFQKTE